MYTYGVCSKSVHKLELRHYRANHFLRHSTLSGYASPAGGNCAGRRRCRNPAPVHVHRRGGTGPLRPTT